MCAALTLKRVLEMSHGFTTNMQDSSGPEMYVSTGHGQCACFSFRIAQVGFADFDIKNEGLSIRLVLVPGAQAGVMAGTNDITRGRIFQVESAKVEVKDLDLRLHDSSHE